MKIQKETWANVLVLIREKVGFTAATRLLEQWLTVRRPKATASPEPLVIWAVPSESYTILRTNNLGWTWGRPKRGPRQTLVRTALWESDWVLYNIETIACLTVFSFLDDYGSATQAQLWRAFEKAGFAQAWCLCRGTGSGWWEAGTNQVVWENTPR